MNTWNIIIREDPNEFNHIYYLTDYLFLPFMIVVAFEVSIIAVLCTL